MLFYTAVFQIYSSLTIFIDRYVDRHLLGWIIPVPAFASLQCVFFIICAPLVTKILNLIPQKSHPLSVLTKIQLGLIIGALGFILFAWGEWSVHQVKSCGIAWIITANFFLGLAEVFLYPPILATIVSFSPKRLSGTLMGIFSMSLALASYFSGQVANFIVDSSINLKENTSVFHLNYAKVVFVFIGIVAVNTLLFSRLKKWYHEQEKLTSFIAK